jgi:signal transduction histidine kinase
LLAKGRTGIFGRPGRFNVPGQVRAALGASLIVLAGIVATAFYVPYKLNETADKRYVQEVIPLRKVVQDLKVHTVALKAAVAEYVITRDERVVELYNDEHVQINRLLEEMEPHVERHPSLEQLRMLATEQIGDVVQLYGAQIHFVDTDDAKATEKRFADADRQFTGFSDTVDDMIDETDRFVEEAQDEQQVTFRNLLIVLGWLGAVGLLIGGTLFIATPRRMGELYAAERRLRREAESRADAARALAHVSDGVVLTDRDGEVRFSNPAAGTLLETEGRDEIGRRLRGLLPTWGPAAGPDDGQAVSPASVVVPLETRSGERWLAITSVDFAEGVVYAIRDVTEERALETMRSELVATASHELRTPMTSIYGAARTLLAHGDLSPERRVAFLEMIASESERLARIVDGMLLASRLDADQVELTSERIDAVSVARSVLESARVRTPENVSLRLDAPVDVPHVACDPNRLRQVLLNLVDNAIKYSPDGGTVELAIHATDNEGVRFVVRDEGLGFPPEEGEKIFERFYRLDPELTRGIGGTGLGLYISRELVERMRGRIWADSEPGRGASFTVELPLAAGSPEAEISRRPTSVHG